MPDSDSPKSLEFPRVFLWALVSGLVDSGGVCSMGAPFCIWYTTGMHWSTD